MKSIIGLCALCALSSLDVKANTQTGFQPPKRFVSTDELRPQTDFDVQMKSAPVLDRSSSKFDEQAAMAWGEVLKERFFSYRYLATYRFWQEIMQIAGDIDAVSVVPATNLVDSIETIPAAMTNCLSRSRALVPLCSVDVFLKQYFTMYVEDSLTLSVGTAKLAQVLVQVGMTPPLDFNLGGNRGYFRRFAKALPRELRGRYALELRAFKKQIRLIIYHPGLTPYDVDLRRGEWAALNAAAGDLEDIDKAKTESSR